MIWMPAVPFLNGRAVRLPLRWSLCSMRRMLIMRPTAQHLPRAPHCRPHPFRKHTRSKNRHAAAAGGRVSVCCAYGRCITAKRSHEYSMVMFQTDPAMWMPGREVASRSVERACPSLGYYTSEREGVPVRPCARLRVQSFPHMQRALLLDQQPAAHSFFAGQAGAGGTRGP